MYSRNVNGREGIPIVTPHGRNVQCTRNPPQVTAGRSVRHLSGNTVPGTDRVLYQAQQVQYAVLNNNYCIVVALPNGMYQAVTFSNEGYLPINNPLSPFRLRFISPSEYRDRSTRHVVEVRTRQEVPVCLARARRANNDSREQSFSGNVIPGSERRR